MDMPSWCRRREIGTFTGLTGRQAKVVLSGQRLRPQGKVGRVARPPAFCTLHTRAHTHTYGDGASTPAQWWPGLSTGKRSDPAPAFHDHGLGGRGHRRIPLCPALCFGQGRATPHAAAGARQQAACTGAAATTTHTAILSGTLLLLLCRRAAVGTSQRCCA